MTRQLTTLLFAVLLASVSAADSLKVDFNGNSYGSVIEQTQTSFHAYNARNEVQEDFVASQYSAFGGVVTVTPTWASPASAAAMQSWHRGNSYGYSTAPDDLLDLVIDWIGTDQREVGDPMNLTISGLPAGSWRSYHHDTQNQTGHFSVTVNDAAGSATTAGLQVSSSQFLSDLTLSDVTKFDATITSDGINPVVFVFEATDAPNYNSMFVMNGFEITNAGSILQQSDAPLRRPISPQQPMWLIHIDTWNYPDPQKIIDLVPQDIRPYAVMNIGLSIGHDTDGRFIRSEYAYEIVKSWLRTCTENRMWAMVQPSSGAYSVFSDFDLSVYEEFYRNYPNMIGFNYCEQSWGYDDNDPLATRWPDRMAHLANLLALGDRYGGYLVVSWCGNMYVPSFNPIGMLKRSPEFAAACRDYTKNYILCEKYTFKTYQSDMESLCLGAYLSGYSGQYGIRYDDTGWTDANGEHANFTMATYGAPFLEHVMLTGQTVIDAPELIWKQCFREISAGSTTNGYTMRQWETFPQFDNVSVDLFRKVLDGTVRIPSRQEVIDRTKVVVINDVTSGSDDDKYSSPESLFEGLYRMDADGNLRDNKSFFKKTGRYPTIPTVYQLKDTPAGTFQVKVNKSAYLTRWPDIAAKASEFNSLFPAEYTGDIYAGRHENGWVTYNPYKTGQTAGGSIPFKYNTCDRMELIWSQYTAGVIKEYADRVTFYLSNYDNVLDTGLKTDVIRIYGSIAEPTYSYADRGSHQVSVVSSDWASGVFTLEVQHNGSLDITVNCAGTAAGRLTDYTPSIVTAPAQPLIYTGPLQYEAECFDYKNIAGIVKGGYSEPVRSYTGQGYLQLGTNSAAAVRDTVTVIMNGTYRLETRYAVVGATVNTIDLYVNGTKAATPVFTPTATLSDWAVNQQNILLNAGANTIEFRTKAAGASSIYFDNIVVVPTVYYGNGIIIQENEPGFVGVDGTIDNTYSGYTGDGYANPNDAIGDGIDWEMEFDASITKCFTLRYACPDNRTADLIINGQIVASEIQFPSTGSWSAWDFVTIYASINAGVYDVRLQSTSAAGLPNVDSMEVTGILAFVPAIPSGLTVAVGDTSVALDWDANTESDLAGYNVYRSTTPASGYIRRNASLLSHPHFTDTNVSNYTTYFYVVTAVDNSAYESGYSEEISAMPNDGRIVQLNRIDFESGLGDWVNITDDDTFDWLRDSGGTLTTQTGPDSGAHDSTWYVYLETSPSGADRIAILESPVIRGYRRTLSFYYHMYGAEMGTLHVDVYDGVWHEAVWSLSGPQQSSESEEYMQAVVDLKAYTGPIKIRFRGIGVAGSLGDMAIDDIEVTGGLLYGDLDGNNVVNAGDLSHLMDWWLQTDCNLDLDGDCVMTLYEFSEFARNWLDGSYQ